MAALSTHPAIVTIHQAGIAGDGRPYLVMEYCSRPNLAVRYRAERMSVAETLRIGVRLAGAVETAHRAGILHRDIKPANVLTTDFGHPALSDFGISAHTSMPMAPGGTVGMSIPWAAPEVFAEGAAGREPADIYSLAATVYTVLARRSPFDRPGGPNSSADLINRIRTGQLPLLNRPDAPPSLERVLARAMDKNPAARYRSALDLARALQQVETELRLAPTPVDVREEEPPAPDEVVGEGTATRIRSVIVVDPQPEPSGAFPVVTGRGGPVGTGNARPDLTDATTRRIVAPAATPSFRAPQQLPVGRHTGYAPAGSGPPTAARPDEDTVSRVPATAPDRSRSRLVGGLIGAGVLLAVVALVLVVVLTQGTEAPESPGNRDTITGSAGEDPIGASAPAPIDLAGEVQGARVVFTWANPDPRPGDQFLWNRTEQGAPDDVHRTVESRASVVGNGRVCIAVTLVRDDGSSSPQPATACAGGAG